MNQITQTNETLQNFQVYVDGELSQDYTPEPPTIAQNVLNSLSGAVEHIKLETRMIAFDALHKTNFRAIRHELVRKQKEAQFVESIGLVATSKEKV